jgi:hypothetical protein
MKFHRIKDLANIQFTINSNIQIYTHHCEIHVSNFSKEDRRFEIYNTANMVA